MKKLAKDWFCTGIHPVTKRDSEEGTAAPGALIRNVRSVDDGKDVAGGPTYYADISTDGGETWWPQWSFERPETECEAEMDERGRIETLRDEAAQAGDLAMVEICDHALDGDEAALRECRRVLREAEAQM